MLPAISPAVISHLAMPNSGVHRYAAALQSLVSAGARDRLARAEEPVVRRLCAGANEIRTIGPSQGRPDLSRVGNGGVSVASRPVDRCAGTVCDGRASAPVCILDRCAAMVFDGGMSVAVRPFDRSAGTACAGGVSVAAGAADLNTSTFSVDDATPAALTGTSPTGDAGRELRAASLLSNGGA